MVLGHIKKGFTLIELLIVIAIIGILAVAFLPNVLKAPSKGRDATRIADLQKIQKVILNANLAGKRYPNTWGYVVDGLATDYASPEDTWGGAFKPDFGGALPVDPQPSAVLPFSAEQGKYYYAVGVDQGGVYSFGLYALMENKENSNGQCTEAKTNGNLVKPTASTASTDWCYVILTQ